MVVLGFSKTIIMGIERTSSMKRGGLFEVFD